MKLNYVFIVAVRSRTVYVLYAIFLPCMFRSINYIMLGINNSDKRNTEAFDNVSILVKYEFD